MHRFYLPSPDIRENILTVRETHRLHQMSRVLRMKPGDLFSFFNSAGEEHSVRVLELKRDCLVAQVLEKLERKTESSVEISLYQAIPKKPALFELIVQKATELGVHHLYPLVTERTEKRRLGKFERLVTIATEATEQSNRLRVPVIHHPVAFESALEQAGNGFLGYEFEDRVDLIDYGKALAEKGTVQIFIGPEGGFTQKEVIKAKTAGIRLYTLGPRILRTETAAMASLAQLLHCLR